MPSPEHPRDRPRPERELPRYHHVARFGGERPAGEAYRQAQDTIFRAREELELSAYRFHLDRVWHVAVLGEPPPVAIDEALRAILSAGEPATPPPEVLHQLHARRQQESRRGPWVEHHHRPGKRLG